MTAAAILRLGAGLDRCGSQGRGGPGAGPRLRAAQPARLGPSKLRLPLVSLNLISLVLLPLVPAVSAGPDTAAVEVPLPAPGRPLDVVLLIDSSPSTRTTDPEGDRYRAAGFLVDYLAVLGDLAGVNHRIAVGNFGATVGQVVPLRLVHSYVDEGFIASEELVGTDFRPALEFASRELRPRDSEDRVPVVVLFTDGQPGTEDGRSLQGEELEQYFTGGQPPDLPWRGRTLPEIVLSLQSTGTEVFVIGINEDPVVAGLWSGILPSDHYIEIGQVADLAWTYHSLFSDLLALQGVSEYRVVPGEETQVELSPLLSEAVFTFLAAGITAAGMTSPGGVPLPLSAGGGPGEIHQVFVAWEPAATGPWRAKVADTEATLLVVEKPPRLVVEGVPETVLVGEPLKIRAAVVRHGRPTQSETLSILAESATAGGAASTVELHPEPEGGWFQGHLEPPLEPGTVEMKVITQVSGRRLTSLAVRSTVAVAAGKDTAVPADSRKSQAFAPLLVATLSVIGFVLVGALGAFSWNRRSQRRVRAAVRREWVDGEGRDAEPPLTSIYDREALAALKALIRGPTTGRLKWRDFLRARTHPEPKVCALSKKALAEELESTDRLHSNRRPEADVYSNPIELLFRLENTKWGDL